MIDSKKLALIHILKRELGLTDEEYHRLLREAAGVETAKELDDEKFRRLMNFFVRTRHYRASREALTLRQKMFIRALAEELGWPDQRLRNFLRKYYRKPDLDRLTRREAMHAIESLKNVKLHAQRREETP